MIQIFEADDRLFRLFILIGFGILLAGYFLCNLLKSDKFNSKIYSAPIGGLTANVYKNTQGANNPGKIKPVSKGGFDYNDNCCCGNGECTCCCGRKHIVLLSVGEPQDLIGY
jgi:hypothetical protein